MKWFRYTSLLSCLGLPAECMFEAGYIELVHEWVDMQATDDPRLITNRMVLIWTFLLRRGGPEVRCRVLAFIHSHLDGERPVQGHHQVGYEYHYGPRGTLKWHPGEHGLVVGGWSHTKRELVLAPVGRRSS